MINNMNTQQIPYIQTPTASAVNIQIFNPQAYSDANVACRMQNQPRVPIFYPQPVYSNYQAISPNYHAASPNYQAITQSIYSADNRGQVAPYPQNYNNDLSKKSKKDVRPVSTNDKEKVDNEKRPKIQLNDEYIMLLESYLNNQDPKMRLVAAKDVFDRFKEDKTRATDLALTALLNKIIQDPAETVRFLGLTALDLEYAKGDDLTVELLKQLQQDSSKSYGEDALLASKILLRMSKEQQ